MNRSHSRKTKNANPRLNQRLVPQYDAKPSLTRKIRYFQSTAITGGVVTGNCLLRLLAGAIASSSTVFTLIAAVRLRAVKMWSASVASSSTLGFSTVRLEWVGTFNRDKEISDSGTATYPAHIRARPPKDSGADFWISEDTELVNNVLFLYDLPQGGLLDLTIDYVLIDGLEGTQYSRSSTSSNYGILTMPLNNITAAGTVGVQSTVPIANETANYS